MTKHVNMTDQPAEKRKAGRPPKVLTEDQIREVETLAAVLSQDQIADYFGMCRNTFAEVMKRDPDISERYARGRARSIGAVAKSLITQALAGNMNAATFYLKTQAGWRDNIEAEAETESDEGRKVRVKFTMG